MSGSCATLTQGSLRKSLNFPGIQTEALLQVLDVQVTSTFESTKVLIVLSDGAEQSDLYVNQDVTVKAKSLEKFDLIQSKIISFGDKDRMKTYLYDFELVKKENGLSGRSASSRRTAAPATVPVPVSASVSVQVPVLVPPEKPAKAERNTREKSTNQKMIAKELPFDLEQPPKADHFTRIIDLQAPDVGFVIRGRVVSKEPLRSFRNGAGQFFSIKIRDATGMIRGTFFKSAARRMHEIIREGKIYAFSGGQVEQSTRYNNTMVPYEILFRYNSTVTAHEDDPAVPTQDLALTTLSAVTEARANSVIDVLAVVIDSGSPVDVALRTGGFKKMRKIQVIDVGDKIYEMIAWGELAEKLELERFSLYLIKSIKIKEFNGERSLLVEEFTEFNSPPQCEELVELLAWKKRNLFLLSRVSAELLPEHEGGTPGFAPGERLYVLSEVMFDSLRFFNAKKNENKRRFYNAVVHLTSISKRISYVSCGISDCKKKVNENSGIYYCEKCQMIVEQPKLRFMADVEVADASETVFARVFGNENCLGIANIAVERLEELATLNEEKFFEFMKSHYNSEFLVRLMVRKEHYEGQDKMNVEMSKVVPFDKFDCVSRASRFLAMQLEKP